MALIDSNQISAAVFCPQNRPPKAEYLEQLRHYLLSTPELIPFYLEILQLRKTWDIYAETNDDIRRLKQGPQYLAYFVDWVTNGNATRLIETVSGIISLPLLTIIQVVQYFQYLEARTIDHQTLLSELRHGGAQGFCGGLLPVMAIASSQSQDEVVQNSIICLRIALGIGAYGELGDDPVDMRPTTMVLRLKHEGQAEILVSKFPGVYISAVSDPLNISVTGPPQSLSELKTHAESHGVPVTMIQLRGKVHNPENRSLGAEFCGLIDRTASLQLPDSSHLQIPVRCNMTGNVLGPGVPLSQEIVTATLVSRCEWYKLLESMASTLERTGMSTHKFAMFGTGRKNLIAPLVFEAKHLKITKVDVPELIDDKQRPKLGRHQNLNFPPDAVAIVGVACRLPGADSLDELWDVLRNGDIKVQKIPKDRLDVSKVSRNAKASRDWYGNFLTDVEAFDNSFFGIGPREATYMDPQQRLLLETSYEALDSSGYLRHHRREDFDRVGCFIGSTYTEYLENTTACDPTAYTATGTIRAFQSGKISYHFGWSGPSEVIDTACSSSLVAIHRACRAIQAGECPMALAGGANIITGMHNFLDLGKCGFLSPTGQCKPFDASGDGYCRADGVGLVVLKPLSEAVKHDDNILGVIPGIATNHGGLSSSITVPYSRAQTELFTDVLSRARLSSTQVSYVEAHGTGTQVGDPIEMASIRCIFGGEQRGSPVHIGSLKANMGHSETAAGVGSLLKVLTMLQHGQIPPLAGFKSLNPKIPALEPDNLHINTALAPWTAPAKAALVNSYGAAGSNAALLCCEAPRGVNLGGWNTEDLSWPLHLSALTPESLQATSAKLVDYIRRYPEIRIRDLSYTLHDRRKHHKLRWVGAARDTNALVRMLESGPLETFECGSSAVKPVVLVFSGQSKRVVGLDTSWYRAFPRLRHYLIQCSSLLTEWGYCSILDILFQSEPVENVVALQCGTFVVQYACARCWLDAGLEVDAVVGHSFGELTAMAVAGILSLEDALRLVATRASLMQTKWGAEKGTMLAVHTNRGKVSELVALIPGLEIACFNGPRSQVIVGSESLIEQAEVLLKSDRRFVGLRIHHQRVSVSHGFHSAFTEPMLEDLGQFARTLQFNQPEIAFESCTKTQSNIVTADRIAEHTREPVFFEDAVNRLEDRLGSCVWLEAGVESPIIPMIKKAVPDPSRHVFLQTGAKHGTDAISAATESLWREGISAKFWPSITPKDSDLRAIWLPPYQFARTRHWLKYSDYLGQSATSAQQMSNTDPIRPSKLITAKGRSDDSWATLLFDVHQGTSRYEEVVSGHAVRGQPLCPASMYMEFALMAAQMMHNTEAGLRDNALKFDNLSFKGALGINHQRGVMLSMEGQGEYLSWNYSVRSSPKLQETRSTTHATGRLSITSPADWRIYKRMVSDQIQLLKTDPRAERLRSDRAYTLFSRVVEYSSVLRGIDQIYMTENQAVAEVTRPRTAVSTSESTAVKVCDAVTLDTFIQVVGLLINSSASCPPSEVFIATNIDNITMQCCDFGKGDSWTAYARSMPSSDARVSGDLFVIDDEDNLVLTASGVEFTRYPITKLERILEQSNINSRKTNTSPQQRVEFPPSRIHVEHNYPTPTHSDDGHDGSTLVPKNMSSVSQMTPPALTSSVLRQLGLDSLSGVQLMNRLASELRGKDVEEPSVPASTTARVLATATLQSADRADTMDHMRARQRILEIIGENSGGAVSDVDNSVCIQDLGIDSLSIIELTSSLEESFGTRITTNDLTLGSTVENILGAVRVGKNQSNVITASKGSLVDSAPLISGAILAAA
ncbi:putative Polyketide synthase [Seiridium cardinale]|uniref:Polyketide synthase n=1 Tax=Seiridium cardinale TaxID=138064 RepID=A0ABR2XGN3_9PEZI